MRCSERRPSGRFAVRIMTAAMALLAPFAGHAEHLGVIGPVYPIAEPDLLQVILASLPLDKTARDRATGRAGSGARQA